MRYLKGIAVAAALASASVTTAAIAEGTPAGEAPVKVKQNINPFSDCGIGAAIFKNDVAAAISNVIWDLGTTAMTSGVSSPETCTKHSTDVAQFILDSYPSVTEDTAKGAGTHLTAMLTMAGCDAADHAAITTSLRTEFGTLLDNAEYATASDLEKAEGFYNAVATSTQGQCKLS